MEKRPWFKFYPSDWRADKGLRLCGAAARGLWIEMLCVMHEAKPYGHLLVNGRPLTETQLASLSGIPLDQVHALLAELENADVFSKNGKGVIYSRRMTRDARKAAKCSHAGKEGGGNPMLSDTTYKGHHKGQSDTTFAPEARSHNPDIPKQEAVKNLVVGSLSSGAKPISKAQIKAKWQSKVCNWAQHRMPEADYVRWVAAWANDEPWAKAKAEEFDKQMKAAAA